MKFRIKEYRHGWLEQAKAVKFQEDIDFESLSNEIDPVEIWNAKKPRAYSNKGKVISTANELFKGTRPLEGEELQHLNEFTDIIILPGKGLNRR